MYSYDVYYLCSLQRVFWCFDLSYMMDDSDFLEDIRRSTELSCFKCTFVNKRI
uniref:Uncharacterized protein n=1 Tax=Arundo donax TaxID=35708 RepID=A0A0A9B694_ARUDO